ncbi:MAG: SRPBCC domain-containing protein [bacterium]|nr:SRPBCC domain-containing protein [bacterium]
MTEQKMLTVGVVIDAPLDKVWTCFTSPEFITQWNFASDDWHAPKAENDLRINGRFSFRMEAKDGSFGFDFGGVYTDLKMHELIAYTLDDYRKVVVKMTHDGQYTQFTQMFEAEQENSIELQQGGWQAILNNFKKFVDNN